MADLKRATWNDETWPEEMESCGYFLAVVYGSFCQEARSIAQVEHARTLGLPVFVVIREGTSVPPDFFDGCDVRVRKSFSDPDELEEVVQCIIEEIAASEEMSSSS